jgi:hypothetical protein
MTIIDSNLLLYAYNADAPQQPAAASWLARLWDGGETIALPWVTIWSFLRICTNSRIWPNPLSARQAFSIIQEWIGGAGVIILQPGPRHAEILEELMVRHHAAGPLVSDTVLAALAVENGAVLASTDQDFRRFPNLRWIDPLHE